MMDVIATNRSMKASSAPRKEERCLAFVVDFWYSQCRQSWSINRKNGERKDLWKFDVEQYEVFDAYKNTLVQQELANNGEICDIAQEKIDEVFESICKDGRAVQHTKFYQLKPKNVIKGTIHECACDHCANGFESKGKLSILKEEIHLKCSDEHKIDDCPEIKQSKKVKELQKEVDKFETHRERHIEQRKEFQRLRDGGLG